MDWEGKFLEDEKQDLQLIDAWQDDAWSVMIFQRKIVTCDDNDVDFKVFSQGYCLCLFKPISANQKVREWYHAL